MKPLSFVLTCQSGLESLTKRECERIGLADIWGQDRLVKGTGSLKNAYELLVWSRFANRVYISIAEEKITDFDALFTLCERVEWSDYLTGKEDIVIEASTTRSALSSAPTIQSVGQKAIYSTLNTPNITNGVEVHILILIIDDIAHILLDITGEPLHKRGYRKEAGEAPIKESLGAALVAFANWKYKSPLLDPFCGSGTIAIEAVMIARNIPPGLTRHFRVESLPFHDRSLFELVKTEAKSKSYPSGKYRVYASDIDPEMIRIARENADRAGVGEDIVFEVKDFLSDSFIPWKWVNGGLGVGTVWVRWKAENRWAERTSFSTPNGFGIHSASSGHAFATKSTEIGVRDPGSPHSADAPFAMTHTIITNPPYGNRIQSDSLGEIYAKLIKNTMENGGGFITTYDIGKNTLANKKLLNGAEECRFWYRKG